jgi:integrase
MATYAVNFTKAELESITPPASGRDTYRDDGQDYLYLFVTPTKKVFYFVRWYKGKTEQIRMGNFPEMTVAIARKKAQENAGEVAQGRDPAQERRADRAVLTFGDLFARYMVDYATPHKRTAKQDQENYDRHVRDPWKARRVDEVTPAMVTRLHNRLTESSGPILANRILALVRGVFNWGVGQELVKVENPCRSTKANRERSRERFMDGDELPRFMEAIAGENQKMQDYFRLLLLTGVRKSSLMRMAWVDVNMGKAIWRVSGEVTKNGDPLTVVLTEDAVAILRRRFDENRQPRTIHGGKIGAPLLSPWVFPSRETGATDGGHLTDVKRAWSNVLKRAGLTDLHIHDLRRTLGSWMATQGSSMLMIGKALGHRNAKSTEVYARMNLDPVRQAVEQATKAMMQVAKGKQA